jgi:integrase
MNITLDKKTKCWFARWRTVLPDGSVKHASVRLMHRSEGHRSKSDVRKSDEYKAIAARIGEGNTDEKHAKLLLAVAEARGKTRPDAADAAVVTRVIVDDSADNMLLTTFIDTVYFPFAEANLRGKTVREYKSIWKRYGIAAKVSGLRVCDFRTKHGSEILEAIAAENDISKSTLQRVKFMLSGVFVLAMNRGLCDANPIHAVMLPKARGSRQTYAYDLDEILAMLRLPLEAKTKAAIGVAAFAALRESEIAGLHWGDYDGETVTVRRSIDRVSGTANAPKTAKSAAPVPVIPTLKRLLEFHKAALPLLPNGEPLPDSPIFAGIRQSYADLDKMALREVRPVLESAGIKWRGWHSFRRGVASNLFQLGVDELTVQRILRHSKVNVTRERYIKVRDERVETAMAAFEEAIAKSKSVQYIGQSGAVKVQ